MTNKEPELSSFCSRSVATCSHWHLFHSISLKGDAGANQSWEPSPAQAIPGSVCCLWEVSLTPSYNITSQLSGMFVTPRPPFLSPHMPQHWHTLRQVPLDVSLTRSLRRDLRLPSPTSPVWCFSLVILTRPEGPKGSSQSMSGRKMLFCQTY